MKSVKLSSSFFFLCFLLFMVMISARERKTSINEELKEKYSEMELPKGVFGPESIAFDCHGEGPYAGVSDGRILRWKGPDLGWTQFAVTSPSREGKLCDGSSDSKREPTCGRPLGLKFNPRSCDLYIADAYFGLLVVGREGGLAKQLVNSAQGIPLRFTNALDIDSQTGEVYFTDSSILFQRRVWLLSIVNGDKTGRLLKYDPRTNSVTVLLKGLAFPNGVALSKDNSFLLMAETGTFKVLKFWLKGPKSHITEIFAQLQRFPDNIKRNDNGDFWVAMNSARGKLETSAISGFIGSSLSSKHGDEKIPWLRMDPVAVKFDEGGAVKWVMDGEDGNALESVSEVEERKGKLWIGSAVKPYVAVMINS